MSQQIFIITGALFGMLAIIFGAFGAHALKKILSEDQLKSFETGVKYQMYHACLNSNKCINFLSYYFRVS